ncbi:MAG: ATP-binding protein [Sandaracinaceae bacterium]|nr:ATP-binding protein [Sandaracinaceae bacterium]
MTFRTSAPVTSGTFFDREVPLARIHAAFDGLAAGAPRWLALVGPRKIGKTSLLMEASRRSPGEVAVAILDVMEHLPLSLDVFRALALTVVDALLAPRAGLSFSRRALDAAAYRSALREAPGFGALPAELADALEALPTAPANADTARLWLELPEALARALDRRLVVAIDELQELAALPGRFEPFPVMRAIWQRHERVGYVISGSAPSMLKDLVTSRHSPFFQHFDLIELGAFERDDAIALLVGAAPRERPIPPALAARITDVVGGHPFYLQIVGESLTAREPPYDEDALKAVIQSLLFSRSGRLSLYFENEYARLVGRATTAAASLAALAERGPLRLTDVAAAIGASTASMARYLERLGDSVVRGDDDRYRIADALFATWIEWRSPGGATVPMRVIGDEAELAVAEHLAALGFDLVYQSRASRGAFDLLALRGPDQLGLQVKRSPLPLRIAKSAMNRMHADARRFGWDFVIVQVDEALAVRVLDPARAVRGKELRLHEDAVIDNLLLWLEARRGRTP